MPRSSRTKDAARRASFGRAERMQRMADAQPKAASRSQAKARPGPAPKQARENSPASARPIPQRHQLTPLHRAQERQDRADNAAERGKLHRLQERTRTDFNREADRRRDLTRRAEYEVKQEASQKVIRRAEQTRQQSLKRQQDRRREETRREFNQKADRRRDQVRRVEYARKAAEQAAREKQLQQRAAAQIEQEQKRRQQDQQVTHRRMTDEMRTRHGNQRHGFRDAKAEADNRLHHALTNSHEREARELAEFDGRRKGLAGRAAELIPGRRAENDRQREAIVERHEAVRHKSNVDHAALRERQDQREQTGRIERMKEQKALFELIRDERERTVRDHAVDRPRQIEDRARVIERADQSHEQRREQERAGPHRENVRPSEDFARAAPESRESSTARDHTSDHAEVPRETPRYISAERVMERA